MQLTAKQAIIVSYHNMKDIAEVNLAILDWVLNWSN